MNGFSKQRLNRMHDVMAGYVQRGEMPGLVTLVSRRGETHADAIGALSIGGPPMKRDTIFRIASMTKPVVAIAALILMEDGKLKLDEPIDRLLPELADREVMKNVEGPLDDTVPAHRAITVRDLLTFRLGYGFVMTSPDAPYAKATAEAGLAPGPDAPTFSPDEYMRRLGSLPLAYQPGERWLYHTGSDVLGVLVARAAGQTFDAFLQERVFGPLGMKDTGFFVPSAKIERLATQYWTNFQTGKFEVYDEAKGGRWSKPPAFASGGSGLVSTVDDFLAFSRMMLGMGKLGGTRIVSRPSVETMITDQLTPSQKVSKGMVEDYFESHGWGFGVAMATRRVNPAEPVGQYGWDGGLGTSWRCDPAEDMVTILLTQRMWTSPNPPDVCVDFWTQAYAAIED
jgi:CubicO group peptidase (beta-lactamase class C family)